MSSEALYEQYKDALKRGHVASLRGRIDDALLAYAEAARIAPERSTPHSSAGNALLRRKRPAEALRHYEVALAMAPRDEAALLGRAQALAALERRGDAADAFDALADSQAGTGRLADAVDAARRGLELAEGRERRRTLERLISRLRASEPDEPGRLALEHALLVLEGPAVAGPKSTHRGPGAGAQSHAGSARPAHGAAAGHPAAGAAEPTSGAEAPTAEAPVAAAAEETAAVAEPGETKAPIAAAEETAAVAEPGETEAASAEPASEVAAGVEAAGAELSSPEPVADAGTTIAGEAAAMDLVAGAADQDALAPVVQAAAAPADSTSEIAAATPDGERPARRARRVVPEGVTVEELSARAEAASDAGAPERALEALLDLATLHARDGRVEAALDTCYAALSLDPDSVALHLALAELYAERGWDGLANEKLALLERLARLDGDDGAVAEIAGVRADRG